MNRYNRGDDLSYNLDSPLSYRHSSSPPYFSAHQACSSHTHFVSECPVTHQIPGSMYDQSYHDQNYMTYRPGNNPDFNAYDPGWGAQPDFSWQPQSVVTPAIQGFSFIDAPYYDQPYSQYQPSPTTYSPLFQEKVLQALDQLSCPPPQQTNMEDDRFDQFHQLMLNQQQSLDEQIHQTDQLILALIKEEEGDLPIQSKSNPEGQNLASNFNDPLISLEQPIITLQNELVKEQLCTTIEIDVNNLTKAELSEEKLNLWDEPTPSLSHLPMAPLPSTLESLDSTSFNGIGEQTDAMMELVLTSQEPQMNMTFEEAIPIIFSQNLLDPYLVSFEMENLNDNGYSPELNDLVETPYLETIPLLIEKHEPSPSPPLVPLLESPSELELKPLLDAPTDTSVILNQEDQLLGVLNMHKEAVGWDIPNMRDHEVKTFIIDFSIFDTTFMDCLQNFFTVLKRCMEVDLRLIWIKYESIHQEGVASKYIISKKRMNKIFKLPSIQQKQSFPGYYQIDNIFKSWSSMLVHCTLLIRVDCRRILYERFSAMITRPPDWPYSFTALRDVLKLIIYWTPS